MKDSAGYSLLEVMVAIVILTVCIIPMAGMFDVAAGSGGARHETVRAEAEAAIEQAVSLGYDGSAETYPPGEEHPCPDERDDGPTCTVESRFVDENLDPVGSGHSGRLMIEVEVQGEDGSTYSQSVLVVDYAP